ncbi:hypothetical protein FN846DRAFT_917919 [Sphaerosporella brunnea]|uniref:DUF423-domain-containing protein n=1 Tax=Sphaerosporella brunnea TaxID=1250544 RepID=A0A5J5F2W4_9PEZI|nr:hypothetical protein FN846DRAFT_917919 [Sphaerosporella brunnea]
MPLPRPNYWTIGCLVGASGVALGAFGAHGLRNYVTDPKALKNWDTAAQYQLLHALAILVASPANPAAAGLFTAGVTMFSGSLYAMVLAGPERVQDGLGKVLGPVTPIGGACLIAGWVLMARKGRIGL